MIMEICPCWLRRLDFRIRISHKRDRCFGSTLRNLLFEIVENWKHIKHG